ncbi:hypothetical protein CPAV1605_365 [seawater metagenome]|uniref:Uncharacterized protein n=1 Tax=seawater metagenome TaxID=1561972 RepID=A0A5E8CLZ3_9ZZZZ
MNILEYLKKTKFTFSSSAKIFIIIFVCYIIFVLILIFANNSFIQKINLLPKLNQNIIKIINEEDAEKNKGVFISNITTVNKPLYYFIKFLNYLPLINTNIEFKLANLIANDTDKLIPTDNDSFTIYDKNKLYLNEIDILRNNNKYLVNLLCYYEITGKFKEYNYSWWTTINNKQNITINEFNLKPQVVYLSDCLISNKKCYGNTENDELTYFINYNKIKNNKISFKINSSAFVNKSPYKFELIKELDHKYFQIDQDTLNIFNIEELSTKNKYIIKIKSSNAKGFVIQKIIIAFEL